MSKMFQTLLNTVPTPHEEYTWGFVVFKSITHIVFGIKEVSTNCSGCSWLL